MKRRTARLGGALVALLLLAGCGSERWTDMASESARTALESAAEIITTSFGDGWTRAAAPSTVACGALVRVPGRRWIDNVQGRVSGIDSSVLASAAAALDAADLEFATRTIGNPVDIVEAVGRDGRGLTVVLTVNATGAVWLSLESACFSQ